MWYVLFDFGHVNLCVYGYSNNKPIIIIILIFGGIKFGVSVCVRVCVYHTNCLFKWVHMLLIILVNACIYCETYGNNMQTHLNISHSNRMDLCLWVFWETDELQLKLTIGVYGNLQWWLWLAWFWMKSILNILWLYFLERHSYT